MPKVGKKKFPYTAKGKKAAKAYAKGEKMESVNNPEHYGGKENTHEAIKVIESWDLNFHLGNVVKYISEPPEENALDPSPARRLTE